MHRSTIYPTSSDPSHTHLSTLASVHRHLWQMNRPMTILFWAMVASSILGLVGILLDPRLVLGQSNWAKTTKFSMSIVLYAGSMLWIFGYDTLRPRLSRFILTASAWILGLEMVLIIFQGARAVPMHFNNATTFDAALFSIMGITITIFWFINALGVGVLVAQQVPSPVLAWGLRLGLVIALLGMLEGFLMTGPTPEQRMMLTAGESPALLGGHTVGAEDGGPGLPLLGWSTTHGDLRIGHFVGLHALQIVPLLGLLLMRWRVSWLTVRHRLALLWTGALGYLGLTALVTWQALRGQPLLAPDLWTVVTLVALIASVGVATATIFLYARRQSSSQTTGTIAMIAQ